MSKLKMPLVYTEEEVKKLKEQFKENRLVLLSQPLKDKKTGETKELQLIVTETSEAAKDAYTHGVQQGNAGAAAREFLAEAVVGRKYQDVIEFLSAYSAVAGKLLMKYQEEFEGGIIKFTSKEL